MQYSRTYDSIDNLPQWNWEQIHQTGNKAYLIIQDSYRKVKDISTPELEELWCEIYDEYLEEFGLTNSYIKLLKEKLRLRNLKQKYILTKDRVILNHIWVAEDRVKALSKAGGKMDMRTIVQHIEKFKGFRYDAKKITVAEYNSAIKTMSSNG